MSLLFIVSNDHAPFTTTTTTHPSTTTITTVLSHELRPYAMKRITPLSSAARLQLTALMMAVEKGSPECVDLLIKAGADLNLKDTLFGVWQSTMNTCSHDL